MVNQKLDKNFYKVSKINIILTVIENLGLLNFGH